MDIATIVKMVLDEGQGPVWKEAVKGTRNAMRTVVKGNSPVKKAILSSEHMLADNLLAERPRGVNVTPGKMPGYFRAPGMMERTQELADAIRQMPVDQRSMTEHGFLKAHGFLQDTEGQRALLPMLERLAAQDTMPTTPLLRRYWQGEIGDPSDKARAARLFVMHGKSPGSAEMDSTSLLDRLSRERDLDWSRNGMDTMKYVRPDGRYDVQPGTRSRSVNGGEAPPLVDPNSGRRVQDTRYNQTLYGDPASGPRPYASAEARLLEDMEDRKAGSLYDMKDTPVGVPLMVPMNPTELRGPQAYGFTPGMSIPGMDNPGRVTHLPPAQPQPNWRSPDEMAAARSAYLRSLPMPRQEPFPDVSIEGVGTFKGAPAPNWLAPIPAGADAPPDVRTANNFVADLLGPEAAAGNKNFEEIIRNMPGAPHRKLADRVTGTGVQRYAPQSYAPGSPSERLLKALQLEGLAPADPSLDAAGRLDNAVTRRDSLRDLEKQILTLMENLKKGKK